MTKYPKIRKTKDWLRVIDKLIDIYKKHPCQNKKQTYYHDCPLCAVAERFKPCTECKLCLWLIFEGKMCMNNFSICTPGQNIKRLRRWKRIINKQIKGA